MDLTNQKFGKLTVIDYDYSTTKDRYWICKCDCGNITSVRQGHLRSGHTKSCGCGKKQLKDLTGQKFGYLTVISRAEDYITPGSGKRYVQWNCECVCGNKTIVIVGNLKSGATISCGCKNPHKLEDLSGQVFGDLTVIELIEPYINPSGRKLIQYKCQCSCGKYIKALADILRRGEVTSCGCKLNSKGELIVKDYLTKFGYEFEFHKSFSDCLSDKGYRLNYDFYLPEDNILIECQGIQHYEPVDFFGGDERFKVQLFYDKIKQDYATKKGYSLLILDCRKENLDNIEFELYTLLN